MNDIGCIIPPFATAFFQTKGEESWELKDLDNMGKNIVNLALALKKFKMVYPEFTAWA